MLYIEQEMYLGIQKSTPVAGIESVTVGSPRRLSHSEHESKARST